MVGHPGGDARPLERWTEMGLVVATDPSPRTRKTDRLQGSRVSGERDERWPGWRKVHLLTLPHTAMQYSSVSKLFRLPPQPP